MWGRASPAGAPTTCPCPGGARTGRAAKLAHRRSSSPTGTVYRSLTYRDVGAALTWLAEAFGFESHLLDEVSAIVRFGGGTAIVQTDHPEDLHGSHLAVDGSTCPSVTSAPTVRARRRPAPSCSGNPTITATATA